MIPGSEDSLEKVMTTHSSIFAWRIPWSEEPGRLHSVGSQRVGWGMVRTQTFDLLLYTMFLNLLLIFSSCFQEI